jgi:CubicO group peptidase (beta-lactamase class C family)
MAQDARLAERARPVLRKAIAETRLSGLAVGIVRGGRLIYAEGFGVRTLADPASAVTPDTLFHMASVTKTFVATSVMQLWEKGKVDLSTPVVRYVPYFRLADQRYNAITVRQMLTHTSGMPDVQDYEWTNPQYDDAALERYVRSLTNQRLISAPGEQFKYSNMAYEVLGDLVAKVSGQSFEEYVRQHILEPLNMRSSSLLVKQADPKRLASPHVISGGNPVVRKVFPYNRMHAPSSTLYSSVNDMSRWAIANLNRGELEGKRILRESTYATMWAAAGEHVKNVGISWHRGLHRDTVGLIYHGGADVGFRSNIVLVPSRGVGLILMGNCDNAPLRELTPALLDVILGLS